jgi:hypothetical protein
LVDVGEVREGLSERVSGSVLALLSSLLTIVAPFNIPFIGYLDMHIQPANVRQ